jgi:hypothetical protein
MMGSTAKSVLHFFNYLTVIPTQAKSGPGKIFIRIALLLALILGVEMLTTPHSASSAQESTPGIRFAVIGDYGLAGPAEQDVANLVKNWHPDFVVTTGDNNYELGEAATIDQNIGQYYHDFIFPYAGAYGPGATVNRFFPAPGNHDWGEFWPKPTGLQPYLDYFTLPGNERYYDFVQGPVHFFMLDDDDNEPDGNFADSVQALWLKNKLATATEQWKIVVLHHPPFSSGEFASAAVRWPFKQWGATAVLSGHEHFYERLFVNDLPYLINGLGGYPNRFGFTTVIPGSQVRYNQDHGAMLVEADQTTITFQFINRAGIVIDRYAIAAIPGEVGDCAPPGLVGWWPANGDGRDIVGGHNGTLNGGVIFSTGKIGQAFEFHGPEGSVTLDAAGLHEPFAALTIDAWVYPLSYGHDTIPGVGILGRNVLSNTDTDGFALRVIDGYVQADLRLTGGDILVTFPQTQIPLTEWSHVAIAYDGTQVRAYLNGQWLGSATASGSIRNTANANTCSMIGNEPLGCDVQPSGFGWWEGKIDEVELFDRALSDSEIHNIFIAGSTGGCKNSSKLPTTTTIASSVRSSVFGQPITLTANVTGADIPTGSVQFRANGVALGPPVALIGNQAVRITHSLSAGLNVITADYSGDSRFLASAGTLAPSLIVSPAAVTSSLTVTPWTPQYSDRLRLAVRLSSSVTDNVAPATGATFFVGSQKIGIAPLVLNGGVFEGLLDVALLEPVPFGTAPTGELRPGTHVVTARFEGVNANYIVNNATSMLSIAAEDARVNYTGSHLNATSSAISSTATVALKATVQDISTTTSASGDASPGDIRNARVTFVITNALTNLPITTISNLPVNLINPNDRQTGAATFNWTTNIGSSHFVVYKVHTIVGGYYARNSTQDDSYVVVMKSTAGLVAGSGLLVLNNSAGSLAGDVGSHCEFGFALKYQPRTSAQGFVTVVFRRSNRTYVVWSLMLTSVTVNVATGKVTLNGHAWLMDTTNMANVSLIDASARLQILMTDRGEPGVNDSLGITISKSTGQLYFSSNWNGSRTIEQTPVRGNLIVR